MKRAVLCKTSNCVRKDHCVSIDRSLCCLVNLYLQRARKSGKKASMRVGVLMRMRNMISIKAKLTIYKAAILPYLTYKWHLCSSDRRKLEKVNERGLRAVFCDWRSSYNELRTNRPMRARITNLTNLYNINRRLQDILQSFNMYKVKFKVLPAKRVSMG